MMHQALRDHSTKSQRIDSNVQEAIDGIVRDNRVSGLVCADENGLCIVAHGCGIEADAGRIVSLTRKARTLSPNTDDGAEPIIAIETDKSLAFIQNHGRYTFSIFKDVSSRPVIASPHSSGKLERVGSVIKRPDI
eukprot:TRINITY_DN7024_c0_g1::TRINITY_DN7024_c0_g1_i1::g.19930::m.19930 TRINITY_DN7024_c0_g1::TRINITY_DN7024_c0_g1_i1::g.19930  ORF type:complete len:135 (-),score=7.18,sp/Q54QW5/LTOR5_DICDI/35.56/2e-09 TRINITY_DN7024_c0_g1_i1:2-406(-)